MYAASLRRARYCPSNSRNAYTFTWTSRSAVQISGATGLFKISSNHGRDITKIDIYRDQFVVAFTASSLLLGNLTTFKLAEIEWPSSGTEQFHFENDRLAMIYSLGELTVVDYERNTPLVSLRTEHMSPYLVSCVFGSRRRGGAMHDVASLAYLVDLQTIRVIDIATKSGPQVGLWIQDNSVDV
jgi:intraflagellar transport protein 172